MIHEVGFEFEVVFVGNLRVLNWVFVGVLWVFVFVFV